MIVSRIMCANVTAITPDTSVRAAAALMQVCDIGILVICEKDRPVGVLTDRDIVVRLMSKTGAGADVPVGEIMSRSVLCCRESDTLQHIAGLMGDHQMRRVVVQDAGGRLTGMISLGDIARDASEIVAGEVLGEIVERR